jgi:ProP effector
MYQGRRRPLKVGIRADVEAALGDAVERKLLQRALKSYFFNVGYQRSLRAGTSRLDLDGQAAGIVSEDDATAAKRSVAGLLGKKPKPVPKRDSLASLRSAARKRRQAAGVGGGA